MNKCFKITEKRKSGLPGHTPEPALEEEKQQSPSAAPASL